MDAEVSSLFVYGTLKPGHLRWPMLAAHERGHATASVDGELWDTGCGWPAARFHHDAGPRGAQVPGVIVQLDVGDLAGLLAALDAMEGIGDPPDADRDPYVRLVVEANGTRAWAYHATRILPTWRRIEDWTDQVER